MYRAPEKGIRMTPLILVSILFMLALASALAMAWNGRYWERRYDEQRDKCHMVTMGLWCACKHSVAEARRVHPDYKPHQSESWWFDYYVERGNDGCATPRIAEDGVEQEIRRGFVWFRP